MHELGIAFQIIKTVERVAQENNLKAIKSVTLELGEVAGVINSQLESCWKWAADKSSVLKGAALDIEEIPAVTFCENCSKTYGTVTHGKICPYCGSGKTYLIAGDEMNIKDLSAE